MAGGVVEQVGRHLRQPCLVGLHSELCRHVHGIRDLAAGQPRLRRDRGHELRHGHPRGGERGRTGVETGEVEEVFDETMIDKLIPGTLAIAQGHLDDNDMNIIRDRLDQSPACLNIVDFDGGGQARLVLFNDVSHYTER